MNIQKCFVIKRQINAYWQGGHAFFFFFCTVVTFNVFDHNNFLKNDAKIWEKWLKGITFFKRELIKF